ncbi:MAG TPA: hypothetical protein VM261_09180 [Kofleriaceae bacterium]|nr:hypothetical protein [Kofleriaceae bacterium]
MRRRVVALAVALAGCKGSAERTIDQYETVPAPVVGRGVTLYLGDVTAGKHATVRVTAPNGDVLAHGELERRDELPFRYENVEYVVIPLWYEDHTISDLGRLRVERRARRARKDQVEIEEGKTGPVPMRPDEQLRVGPIELDRLVDLTHVAADGHEGRDAYAVGEAKQFGDQGADYSLTLLGVSFQRGGVDRAIVRFRSGRQ